MTNTRKAVVAAVGLVLLSLLLAGCGGLFTSPVTKEAVPLAPGAPGLLFAPDPRLLGESVIEGEYIPGRLVVGYRDTAAGRASLDKIVQLVGKGILTEAKLDDLVLVCILLKDELSVEEALGMVLMLILGRSPDSEPLEDVVFVEPDYNIPAPEPIPGPDAATLGVEPKIGYDPYPPNEDLRPYQWGLDAVKAEAAWALGYTGNGIIVAVMDTGVDGTHPDLQGQLVDGIEVRNMTSLPATANSDTDGHGTHCAGIIAAKNDGKGVVGLAYNAKIMPIRIFDPVFIGTVNYARGVLWAIANGAKVLSNSWGGGAYSHAIKAAVDYALANGVVVVVSAGNDYIGIWRRPASIPGAIAVAATNPQNRKVDFSTPGTWVSVGAPGWRVLSSVRTQITRPGVGGPIYYDYYNGTSMACPHVSALAAMILEKHPTATPYQVKKLLEATALDIEAQGFDPGTGYGLIQADKALTAALPADNGGGLRIHVVSASSQNVFGQWLPLTYMDITLRKDGRTIGVGQTDYEGWFYLGFPMGDYWLGYGLGYFPILEPGTYEVLIGGDDCNLFNYRTANRVTAKTTVTVTAGQVTTITVPVNTTLEVTLTWTGGADDTDIDLAVYEPYLEDWTSASSPGIWGEWSSDASGASGTETYRLYAPGEGPGGHGGDAFYPLAVVFNGGTPATVTVTVTQNGVTETYTFALTSPGWYYAYNPGPPVVRWPGWWNNYPGPYVF